MLGSFRWLAVALMICSGAAAQDVKQVPPPQIPAVPLSKAKLDELKRKYPVTITVDTSETPEFREWAAAAVKMGQDWYPWICDQLASPGFTPPRQVKVKIFREYDGIAATGGDGVSMGSKWFTDHPDDMGALFHEFVHVVQSYRGNRGAGFITEGIADHLRWFRYEPENKRPRVNPDRARYTDGYQTTAAFLEWISKHGCSNVVQRLNAVMRTGRYSPQAFLRATGYDIDVLWAKFIADIRDSSRK